MRDYDDSRLLDLLIEGDAERIEALDETARARLEELRRLRTHIRAIDETDAVALRPEQIDAAVAVLRRAEADVAPRAMPDARPAARTIVGFPVRRLAWAALLVLGALVAVLAVGRGDQSTVYADVFGTVDVYTPGDTRPLVRDVDKDGFNLEAGMTVKTAGGCMLNIADRFRCRAGHDTEFVIEEIGERHIRIDLLRGMFRVENPPPTEGREAVKFIVSIGGTQIHSEDAVYSVQHLGESHDHLIVDAGDVTIACGDKRERVTPDEGAYRYTELCPCEKAALDPDAPLAPSLAPNDSSRHFPVQRDPKNALEIARQHTVPVLVTRKDGPAIDACFGGSFPTFVTRSRQLAGLVWLVLDPVKDAAYLASIGLTTPDTAVVVDHRNVKLASGPVRHANGMCAQTLCNLLRKARVKCKDCPLR